MQQQNFFYSLFIFMVLFFTLAINDNVIAGTKLLENWDSTPALDASWGNTGGEDQQVYIQGGELHQIVRPYSAQPGYGSLNARVRFLSSEYATLTKFQATFRLENVCDTAANAEFDLCSAEFLGFFYNTGASPANQDGDVFFYVRFGDRGSGLEVWWAIYETVDSANEMYNEFASGTVTPPPGGWLLSQNYTLDLSYDDVKTFTGTFGGRTISGAVGPDRSAAAYYAGKWIRSRLSLVQPFTGNPDTNMLHAVFDNVQIGLGAGSLALHDDFNNGDAALSTSKWDDSELARESTVTGNMLKMSLKTVSTDSVDATGVSFRSAFPDKYGTTDYVQADLKITGGVTADGTRGEMRLEGVFGNAKYTANTWPGNADGEVFVAARLRKSENSPYGYDASCTIDRCDNGDCSSLTSFPWDSAASATASADTMYTASINKSGTLFSCRIVDTASSAVLVDTSVNLASHGVSAIYPVNEFKRLRVRVRYAPGAIEGYYDNVYVQGSNLLLGLIPVIIPKE